MKARPIVALRDGNVVELLLPALLNICCLFDQLVESTRFRCAKLNKVLVEGKEMQEIIKELGNGPEAWKKMIVTRVSPWLMGKHALPLEDLELLEKGRFLVPGCGQGFDVAYLASRWPLREVIGLDIVDIQVEECKELWKDVPNADFRCVDFFDSRIDLGLFDFMFDYTFFCAIDPSSRKPWGERVGQLIRSGGTLATLMFPLDEMSEGWEKTGPPFVVSLEEYRKALPGFELLEVREVKSISGKREGREKLAIWKKS